MDERQYKHELARGPDADDAELEVEPAARMVPDEPPPPAEDINDTWGRHFDEMAREARQFTLTELIVVTTMAGVALSLVRVAPLPVIAGLLGIAFFFAAIAKTRIYRLFSVVLLLLYVVTVVAALLQRNI